MLLRIAGNLCTNCLQKIRYFKIPLRALRDVVHLTFPKGWIYFEELPASNISLFIPLSLSRCKMMVSGTDTYYMKFCIWSPKHARKRTGSEVGRQTTARRKGGNRKGRDQSYGDVECTYCEKREDVSHFSVARLVDALLDHDSYRCRPSFTFSASLQPLWA